MSRFGLGRLVAAACLAVTTSLVLAPPAEAAANRTPVGAVDTVSSTMSTSITVGGWTLDPDTMSPINVHIYVDGSLAAALPASGSRPDVGAAFGYGDAHGFTRVIAASAGAHTVCVYAIDASGAGPNPQLGCRNVAVVNRAPVGSVDRLTATDSAITVAGWALDPDTSASVQVHVYVDGALAGVSLASGSRPDVGTAYGKGDKHGFTLTYPAVRGTHHVCVYAIDAGGTGPNPALVCRTAQVVNHEPVGSIDAVTASTGTITVVGWALDPDTAASIPVHVYIDGQFAGAVTTDRSRPDVGAALGDGDVHGFAQLFDLLPYGVHQVCFYAIDSSGTGPNPSLGCRIADARNHDPVGAIDSIETTATNVLVKGWTYDPDDSASREYQIVVDGVTMASGLAEWERPDIAQQFGVSPWHGVVADVYVGAGGTHQVCLATMDDRIRDRWVTVACRSVWIENALPMIAVDSATYAAGTLTVTGWALDPDTSDPIGAYFEAVDAAGQHYDLGWGSADLSRPDVAAAFGRGDRHGFVFQRSIPAYTPVQICAQASDSQNGKGSDWLCKPVTA